MRNNDLVRRSLERLNRTKIRELRSGTSRFTVRFGKETLQSGIDHFGDFWETRFVPIVAGEAAADIQDRETKSKFIPLRDIEDASCLFEGFRVDLGVETSTADMK